MYRHLSELTVSSVFGNDIVALHKWGTLTHSAEQLTEVQAGIGDFHIPA
jgi:hypothetical protein